MSLFTGAKSIAPAAPKAKGKTKAEIPIAGVEHLAMVDALLKALETVKDSLDAGIKDAALLRFVSIIEATGTRPESFRAIEGGASASCELRKRGSNHPLNDGQIELLRANGIEPAREMLVPELFGINPTYGADDELLAKVSAALDGIVPADFIVKQEGRYKYIVTDAMLDQACREKRIDALPALTTQATKPKLANTNLAAILDFVRGLIVGPIFGEAANEAPAAKAENEPARKVA